MKYSFTKVKLVENFGNVYNYSKNMRGRFLKGEHIAITWVINSMTVDPARERHKMAHCLKSELSYLNHASNKKIED